MEVGNLVVRSTRRCMRGIHTLAVVYYDGSRGSLDLRDQHPSPSAY